MNLEYNMIFITSFLASLLRLLGLLLLSQPLFLFGFLNLFSKSLLFFLYLRQLSTQLAVLASAFFDLLFELILLGSVRREGSKVLSKHFQSISIGDTLIVLLLGP